MLPSNWMANCRFFQDYPYDVPKPLSIELETLSLDDKTNIKNEVKKPTRFWQPTGQPSFIQMLLQGAVSPDNNPEVLPSIIQSVWTILKSLTPFTVLNAPTQHFHLFLDDLNRCWQLGLFNTAENKKNLVKLSHPLDWIDFCRSLPPENQILNRKEQCQLLAEAMAEYAPKVFNNTFSLAASFDSQQYDYAPYLAAAVAGTKVRAQRLSLALALNESKKWGETLNKNCFVNYFEDFLSYFHLRYKTCKFINQNYDSVLPEHKELMKQFVTTWEIKGWDIDFKKIIISLENVDQFHALATFYFNLMNYKTVKGAFYSECIDFIDATDLLSLFRYMKDPRSESTLRDHIREEIHRNWIKSWQQENYYSQIKMLGEDDIPILLQIFDVHDFDYHNSDDKKVYELILKALDEAQMFQFKEKLQVEVKKIQTKKKTY